MPEESCRFECLMPTGTGDHIRYTAANVPAGSDLVFKAPDALAILP